MDMAFEDFWHPPLISLNFSIAFSHCNPFFQWQAAKRKEAQRFWQMLIVSFVELY
jgi:hypothetical protein